jgi:hypothetical protein
LKNKKLLMVAIAIAAIALSGLTAGLILSTPSSQPSTNQDATNANSPTPTPGTWMVKGAYATYAGTTDILSTTITFTAKMEIVDVNATHIQVQTNFNISTPFGDTQNTTTTWVNKEEMTFQPEGLTLNSTDSNAQVTIPGLGTRTCTVYQYQNEDISATYYVDNATQWPVKMTMASPEVQGQSYNMDIILVQTNIPGI